MKYLKLNIYIAFVMIFIFSQCSTAQKNKGNKDSEIFKNMLESKHFDFVAQTVTPLRGQFRNLTSLYDVSVSNDSLVSYLPYFGRAYTAPLNPTESGLDFTSTNFSYSITPHKKSGWYVVLKPKDNTAVQQFTFTIYNNGTASLNVISTSRDAISFNGYIQKERKR